MELEKLKPNSIKGIDFIQIPELPEAQRNEFISWLEKDQIITISTNNKVYPQCVQYSIYNDWFNKTTSRADC